MYNKKKRSEFDFVVVEIFSYLRLWTELKRLILYLMNNNHKRFEKFIACEFDLYAKS